MAHRLTLLVAVAALAAGAPVAYGATGSAPVTASDTVEVHAGEGTAVDLTANDTDPDGDELAVCRLGSDVPRKLEVSIEQGHLVVWATRAAKGKYTFTYYACDTSYLTPGQVTVKVGPPVPTLELVPLGAPPGKLRIVNTYKHQTFRCEWHPLDEEKIEGRATVRPRSTVVIRVHEAEVGIDCVNASGTTQYSFAFAAAVPVRGRADR